MALDETDIDLIERFLEGSLTPEEEAQVRIRIEQDKEFAEALSLRQELPDLWRQANRYQAVQTEVSNAVGALANEMEVTPTKNIHLFHRIQTLSFSGWAIAASIVLIIGLAIAWVIMDNGKTGGTLQEAESSRQADTLYQLQMDLPDAKATLDYVMPQQGEKRTNIYPTEWQEEIPAILYPTEWHVYLHSEPKR